MSELPRLFIASSKEALSVAEAVNIKLESAARIKQWDNAFDLSSFTLPSLVARTKETDFAVFVFHKDDQTIIRGNTYSTVRDNVLFELGLFIGALGIEKCFVLVPKSVEGEFRLPTDLAGLITAAYDDTIEDMVDAVTTSCAKIKQAIRKSTSSSESPLQQILAVESIQPLQSELWRARIDLERANEQAGNLRNAITNHFHAIAKPATETEMKRWEEGAAGSYATVPRIDRRNVFYLDRVAIIPPLYGAHSVAVIVATGVRVFGLDQWSHNTVYFMDGFRMHGM